MKTRDFQFELPPGLIAQHPLAERSASRPAYINSEFSMMFLHRSRAQQSSIKDMQSCQTCMLFDDASQPSLGKAKYDDATSKFHACHGECRQRQGDHGAL